jgi:hypothetical protein
MKKIISLAILVLLMGSCTKNFDEINTNPYQITDESLTQDFNHVGAYFQGLLANLQGHQVEEDLLTDSFVRHFGTPTPLFPTETIPHIILHGTASGDVSMGVSCHLHDR